MIDQWEIPKNQANLVAVLVLELVNRLRKLAARRTLKIAELFERNRRVGWAEDVDSSGFNRGRCDALFRNGQGAWPLRAIEGSSAADGKGRHDNNNQEGKITFHRTETVLEPAK